MDNGISKKKLIKDCAPKVKIKALIRRMGFCYITHRSYQSAVVTVISAETTKVLRSSNYTAPNINSLLNQGRTYEPDVPA